MKRQLLGQYTVIDPEICHGKPTFIGTRIMVAQVLEMVAEGRNWDSILAAWNRRFPKEAIAEAVELAREAFLEKTLKRNRNTNKKAKSA